MKERERKSCHCGFQKKEISARLNIPPGLITKERPTNEQFPRRLFAAKKNVGSSFLDEITVCIHHPYRAIRVITFILVSDDYCSKKRARQKKEKKEKEKKEKKKKKKKKKKRKKSRRWWKKRENDDENEEEKSTLGRHSRGIKKSAMGGGARDSGSEEEKKKGTDHAERK